MLTNTSVSLKYASVNNNKQNCMNSCKETREAMFYRAETCCFSPYFFQVKVCCVKFIVCRIITLWWKFKPDSRNVWPNVHNCLFSIPKAAIASIIFIFLIILYLDKKKTTLVLKKADVSYWMTQERFAKLLYRTCNG